LRRNGKRIDVHPSIFVLVGKVGIGQYLVGASRSARPVGRSGKCGIDSATNSERRSRHQLEYSGKLPTAEQTTHGVVGKPRARGHGGKIHNVQPVPGAIRTVVFSEARSDSTGTRLRHNTIADAVRPGVIPEYGETLGTTALDGQQHRVVTAGTAVLQIADGVVIRSLT